MARIGAVTLAVVAALAATVQEGGNTGRDLPVALALCLFAGISAGAWTGSERGHVLRFAPAFVLAAWIALSPAAGVWVCIAALAVNPSGITGLISRRSANTVAVTAAILGTYGAARLFAGSSTEIESVPAAIQAPVLYLIFAGLALCCGWVLLGILERSPAPPGGRFPFHGVFLEMLNIPLALLLVSYIDPVLRPWPFLLFSCLILLGALALRKLAMVRAELQSSNDALAARVSELATLHSIGREIVSSLDLQKVFIIVERECRKIIDISRFSIALTVPGTGKLENVYFHTRGESGGTGGAVRRIEQWVAAEKRGMRIGHGQDELTQRGLRNAGGTGDYPSTLAVPLIVEERVVGVLMVQSVLRAAYDEHHLAVLTTIAQQAAVAIENARNYRMATVDSLTGVSLRDYFFQRVREEHHRASRYHSRFALLMIDLDGFKAINDAHGHQIGDRYLSLLGSEIRSHLRSADLACRYGGDEFCILLPETGFEGAQTIAERLRHAIANLKLELDGETAATTVSIGMAIFPEHGSESLSSLLRHADQALYRAKRQGKDRVLPFEPRQRGPAARTRRPEPPERSARPAGRNVR